MGKKQQMLLLVLGSVALIAVSSLIKTENSSLLGGVQTLVLGLGILGCCRAAWIFAKGDKRRGGN